MTCFTRAYWLCLVVFSFSVLAYPDLSFSGNENQRVQSALKGLKARSGGKIDVTWEKDKPRIRMLRGKLSASYSGAPEQAATRFLADNPDLFQLDSSLSDLSVDSRRQIGGGELLTTVVRFKQTVSGVPVFDGGLEVFVKSDGSIDQVKSF